MFPESSPTVPALVQVPRVKYNLFPGDCQLGCVILQVPPTATDTFRLPFSPPAIVAIDGQAGSGVRYLKLTDVIVEESL